MSISLADFFEHDQQGNIVKNDKGIAQINKGLELDGKPIIAYDDYLRTLDEVTSIGYDKDDPMAKYYVKELTKLSLHKFQEHLEATKGDWYDTYNPKMYTISKQLESLAYLTGEQEGINKILQQFPLLSTMRTQSIAYQNNNFLGTDSPLKFRNFDRNVLAVQMSLRVLDPRFINQRNEQVCGVNAYVHNIALFDPLQYVQMVSKLASDGKVDLQGSNTGKKILQIKISDDIANKESSLGDEIHDADHIILNGLRASQNNVVSYSEEGNLLSKQLFGVTTHHEVNHWMKQSGYLNVQNISIQERQSIKQLQLLINDGYMVGFAGTSTLADFIIDNSQEPKKQSVFKQFMDGHLFTIRDIKYDEQKDTITVRIMTWGKEVDAEIPFESWKAQVGLVGQAIVGQPVYANIMLHGKAREIQSDSIYCSPESYCLNIKNVIEQKPEYKDIRTLLEDAFKHKDGQTWMDSAKKIQDLVEALPHDIRLDIPSKIAIVPSGASYKLEEINKIRDPETKVKALEELGAQNNIEVQKQLFLLYAQEGNIDKINNLFKPQNQYSKSDRAIMYENLKSGCDILRGKAIDIPCEVQSLLLINAKADDLIVYLSDITGISKGGAFTYGLNGRLLEVINQRYQNEGREGVSTLDDVWLDKTDVINFISLLDKEIKTKNSLHEVMDKHSLEESCDTLIEGFNNKDHALSTDDTSPGLKGLSAGNHLFDKITEFFLKVASIFSDNKVTNSIANTNVFKNELNQIKESSPIAENSENALSTFILNRN